MQCSGGVYFVWMLWSWKAVLLYLLPCSYWATFFLHTWLSWKAVLVTPSTLCGIPGPGRFIPLPDFNCLVLSRTRACKTLKLSFCEISFFRRKLWSLKNHIEMRLETVFLHVRPYPFGCDDQLCPWFWHF